MRFNLATIAYVFALTAAALAALGAAGLVVATFVLVAWAVLFGPPQAFRVAMAGGAMVIATVIALLKPWLFHARGEAVSSACQGHGAQLGLALRLSDDQHGSLPPATSVGDASAPPQSWRARLTPYFDPSSPGYRPYRMTEPWDSRYNRAVATSYDYATFRCRSQVHDAPSPVTHYFAVVDERSAWPPGRGRKLDEFTDDRRHTILLIEAPRHEQPWAQPGDLTFDEAVELLSGDDEKNAAHLYDADNYFSKPRRTLTVTMADFHTRSIRLPLSRQAASALLTIAGGEKLTGADLATTSPLFDPKKCLSFTALALVAVLPFFRRRRSPALNDIGASGNNDGDEVRANPN